VNEMSDGPKASELLHLRRDENAGAMFRKLAKPRGGAQTERCVGILRVEGESSLLLVIIGQTK